MTLEGFLQMRDDANALAEKGDITMWQKEAAMVFKPDGDPGDAYITEGTTVWIGYTGPKELVPEGVAVVSETELIFADGNDPRILKHMKSAIPEFGIDFGMGFHLVEGGKAVVIISPLAKDGDSGYTTILADLGGSMISGLDLEHTDYSSLQIIQEGPVGGWPTDIIFTFVDVK